MYKIKMLNKISPTGLKKLDYTKFMVGEEMDMPDGILVRSADMHSYDFNDNLRAIARAGAGVNNIPVELCSEKGIVVFNTPGANANAVKELVLCALLMASRDIAGGIEWVNTLPKDEGVAKAVEKGKGQFRGPELEGKAIGVIGLGAIGVHVANISTKLGMTVYGYDPYLSLDHALDLSRSVIRATAMKTIFDECDYISLHLPLSNDTRAMFNTEVFSFMKQGVRIVNLARGELVNDDDMIEAIEKGQVAAYVTDFPNAKLIGRKNIVCIPHLGASTPESEENCARMAVSELSEYLEHGTIKNSVNLPTVEMERTGKIRMGVVHRNIPNMLSEIISRFSAAGVNIENMVNRSKGSYAYTLMDFADTLPEEAVKSVRQIEDVLRLRVIK